MRESGVQQGYFQGQTAGGSKRERTRSALLDATERAWVDDYHAQVHAVLAPQLTGEERAWLDAACAPLTV